MRELTIKEQQEINLALLCYFDEVCRKNHIHYSLTGGTLLGAVRHKGFIPWDDDVDVFLTRPEFNRLEAVFPTRGRYIWQSRKRNPHFEYVYGRLLDTKTIILDAGGMPSEGKGIFLDVCVVDGLPDDERKRKRHIRKMKYYYKGRRAVSFDKSQDVYYEKGFPVRFLKWILRHTTNLEFWQKKLEREMSRYPFEKGQFVGNFTSQYGEREMLHRSVFDAYVEMEFEGRKFEVCAGWKEYLTNIYGDYMQLPPVEKRISNHIGTAYVKE